MFKNLLDKFRKDKLPPILVPQLMDTYTRLPVSFVRGEGSRLWDVDGNCYIDALGGIAVTILGHSHPAISETISLQANKLLHVSNLFHIQEQAQLASKFCSIAQMDKVFFANSGAEANEAAIKLARLHATKRNIAKPVVVAMQGSFHGRSLATLSASGNKRVQQGFVPLVDDFEHIKFNDIDALGALAANNNVVAVILEPIQGEAGIVIPDEGYLRAVRDLCAEHDWLMIVDEVQSGLGRTGKWFAYQHEDILPDIVTSAKGLGNGIPIGACAARGKAADLFSPGDHASTFGGNPFSSSVALTVINTIESDGLVLAAEDVGEYLKRQIQHRVGTLSGVVDIRGKGMMLAIELDSSPANLATKFLLKGLVVNVTGGGRIIRLLPAINLTRDEAVEIATLIHDVLIEL